MPLRGSQKREQPCKLLGRSPLSLALSITSVIDEINRRIGIIAIYLVLFASLVSAFNAIFRYSTNGIMWLERYFGGGR